MAPATRRIKFNDFAWLLAERRQTPVHIGVLAVFQLPDGAPPSFLRDLVARWRTRHVFGTPFDVRLRMLPVPSWERVPPDAIDLDYHLRHSALPQPGGERELGVLVSRLHTQHLDRAYPLWEAHVIEGLANDRFALYVKAHHALLDGVAGVRILRRFLSPDPARRDMPPPWEVGARDAARRPTGADRGPGLAAGAADRPAEPAGGAAVRAGAAAVPAVAAALGRTLRDSVLGPPPPFAAPFRAPKTPLNGTVSGPRRFATQNYELARVTRLAATAGVTLNDVFLGVCAGALRRYLDELGELPARPLTALLPVSVRAGDERAAQAAGNAISFVYTSLATDVADPVARLAAISASSSAAKRRLPPVRGAAMDAYTALLMAPYLAPVVAGVSGHGAPAANVVVSNVPGPRETLHLDGAPLREAYPVSVVFDGQALNITVVSYAGRLDVGYTGCRDTMPHMQRLAVYSGDALDELEAAVTVNRVDLHHG